MDNLLPTLRHPDFVGVRAPVTEGVEGDGGEGDGLGVWGGGLPRNHVDAGQRVELIGKCQVGYPGQVRASILPRQRIATG